MSPEIVPCLSTQSSTILETVIWVFPKRVSKNADLGLREGDEKSTNHFFTLWSICQSWVWTHLKLPAKTLRLGLIGLTRPNEGLRLVMGFFRGRYGPAAPNLCLNTATNTGCYLPESCMKRNKACNKHERRSQSEQPAAICVTPPARLLALPPRGGRLGHRALLGRRRGGAAERALAGGLASDGPRAASENSALSEPMFADGFKKIIPNGNQELQKPSTRFCF